MTAVAFYLDILTSTHFSLLQIPAGHKNPSTSILTYLDVSWRHFILTSWRVPDYLDILTYHFILTSWRVPDYLDILTYFYLDILTSARLSWHLDEYQIILTSWRQRPKCTYFCAFFWKISGTASYAPVLFLDFGIGTWIDFRYHHSTNETK